jgi:4-hydroxyphenylpyruvate dioxygenase
MAPVSDSLGIIKLEALTLYVNDLARARAFLVDKLDFAETGRSNSDLNARGKQQSAVFEAGDATVIVCAPQSEGSRAWRYLRKHPEGIGTLTFAVQNIEQAFSFIEARGGTIIADIERFADEHGTLAMFSIATPLGDTTFRFIERNGYQPLFPGCERISPTPTRNTFNFRAIDHVTTNFQTMAPALLWMEHVLGFQKFWDVTFHTDDVAKHGASGSGLKSIVMWDPHSGLKFACNEPLRPQFKNSQINLFVEDHRGDGVQHAALAAPNIIEAVRGLRARGVQFMPTPNSYFDVLQERLNTLGVGTIDEDIETLRTLEILVDGEGAHQYLLQIFLKEAASIHADPNAGPFFFEIIQRKGSRGFGAGNFRALFESIEREQKLSRGIS